MTYSSKKGISSLAAALLSTSLLLAGCAGGQTSATAASAATQTAAATITSTAVSSAAKTHTSVTAATETKRPETETTVPESESEVSQTDAPGTAAEMTSPAAQTPESAAQTDTADTDDADTDDAEVSVTEAPETAPAPETTHSNPAATEAGAKAIYFDSSWEFAGNAAITSGAATLYTVSGGRHTVCVNAGHGTAGGSSVRTLCHPDGSAKVSGGTTAAGSTTAIAVSSGTTLSDGTTEADANLAVAQALKSRLLAAGYNVLMIRDGGDIQLDNVARTLIANHYAECHISIHYDSTESDKGAFFIAPSSDGAYRSMYPVSATAGSDIALGNCVINGLSGSGVKIWNSGILEGDLTQISYSTIPTIDLEVGDRASSHNGNDIDSIAAGITVGVQSFLP